MELVTLASATAATGFLACGVSRLAWAGWNRTATNYRHYRSRSEQADALSQQAERARMSAQARWQNSYSPSNPWRVMEVVELVDESVDVRSFYLQDPIQPVALPAYSAGQFLIVRPALGGADQPARCYSLSDAPGYDWYRISVKRQTYDQRHGASLSNWLHDHIRTGDCLLVSGPHGEFFIEESVSTESPIVLLAAGIGITPMLSMLKSRLTTHPTQPIHLFFQAQDLDHWPFGELVHSWSALFENLTVRTFFSRVPAEQLPCVDGGTVQSGKFDAQAILNSIGTLAAPHVYLCGPDAWMNSLVEAIHGQGIPQAQIHFESFAPPSTPDNAESISPWSIEFARSEITTPMSEQPSTVLRTAMEHGVNIPSACQTGACGTCKLKLLKGSVQYKSRPTCSHNHDEVVTCVAQPIGTIAIDA